MTSLLSLSRVHYPVDVLGPGRRVGIWLQGCNLRCPGCVSRDTWDPAAGDTLSVDDLVDLILDITRGAEVSGVTVSGGEPFQQAEALAELLDMLVPALVETQRSPVDVLVYSGLSLEYLQKHHGRVLHRIDALIPEPYGGAEAPGGMWRGSANQPLVLLTDLARERYAAFDVDGPSPTVMQVAVDERGIWMIGIPRPGDMRRLEAELREQGVVLDEVSWRP